jgi:hypothetical protein
VGGRPRPDELLYQIHRPRLMRQYHRRCGYCRRRLRRNRILATIDHIIAYRDGGPPDPANLRPSCLPCNRVRDRLTYAGIADPQGSEIVEVYAFVLLLLGDAGQDKSRLAAAGKDWSLVAPALTWLAQGELAVRGQGRKKGKKGWRATRTGLKLARAIRTGARDTSWLRRVLGDPRMVHYARRGPRELAPALLARYVDDNGTSGPQQTRRTPGLARAAA